MKKCGKLLLSLILTTALCAQPFVYPVYAQTLATEEAQRKIDTALHEQLDVMEDTDTAEVSVWVTDIDHEKAEEKTQQALEEKVLCGEAGRNALKLSETAKDDKEGAARSVLAVSDLQALEDISQEDAQAYIETKRAAASAEYKRHQRDI